MPTVLERHVHRSGEEVPVLDGTFSGGTGDHGADPWLSSSQWSQHAPCAGLEGTLLHGKLRHTRRPTSCSRAWRGLRAGMHVAAGW
jgi:hypothetical protein